MRKDRGGGGFIAGVPIWNSEFKFEMKWAGYLLAVIPGWSVLAEAIAAVISVLLRSGDWLIGQLVDKGGKASGLGLRASRQ
jgi:hypothetical protein